MAEQQGNSPESQDVLHGGFQPVPQEIVDRLQRSAKINNNDLGSHPAFICHPDSTHSGQCLICVHHLESIYICIDSLFSNINHQCIDPLGAFVVATMMKKKVLPAVV